MKSRKTNRAKQVSGGCRNHGPCAWCRGNRLHSSERHMQEEPDAIAFEEVGRDWWFDYAGNPEYGECWEWSHEWLAAWPNADVGVTLGDILIGGGE